MYLRSIARKHVQGEVNAADIEKDAKRRFGIDLTGKLAELQESMDKSKAIYDRVREQINHGACGTRSAPLLSRG